MDAGRARRTAAVLIVAVLVGVVGYWARYGGRGTPELFVIDSKYQGEVIVVLNDQEGSEPQVRDGKIVLEIPDSDILFTRYPGASGWLARDEREVAVRHADRVETSPFIFGNEELLTASKSDPTRIAAFRFEHADIHLPTARKRVRAYVFLFGPIGRRSELSRDRTNELLLRSK